MNVAQKPADGKHIWWRFRKNDDSKSLWCESLRLAHVDHIGCGTIIKLTACSPSTKQKATQAGVYSYYDIEWEYDVA